MTSAAHDIRWLLQEAWRLRRESDHQGMIALLSPLPKEILTKELEFAHLLSWGLREVGEFQRSLDLQLELEPLFRARGNDWLLRWWLLVAGSNWMHLASAANARACFSECLDLADQAGDQYSISWATNNLGAVDSHEGKYGPALANFQRANAANHRIGYLRGLAFGYHNAADVHAENGKFNEALTCIGRAADYSRSLGTEFLLRWHDVVRARVFREIGEPDVGKILLERAYTTFTAAGALHHQGVTLFEMALGAKRRGDSDEAARYFVASRDLAQRVGSRILEAGTLVELALLADSKGHLTEAVSEANKAYEILLRFGSTYHLDRRLEEFSAAVRLKIGSPTPSAG